jgi:hypothetical protein
VKTTENSGSFSYLSPESRVPKSHPLRRCIPEQRPPVDRGGATDSGAVVADSVSDPQRGKLLEQLDYNPLFRWFMGLSADEQVRDD